MDVGCEARTMEAAVHWAVVRERSSWSFMQDVSNVESMLKLRVKVDVIETGAWHSAKHVSERWLKRMVPLYRVEESKSISPVKQSTASRECRVHVEVATSDDVCRASPCCSYPSGKLVKDVVMRCSRAVPTIEKRPEAAIESCRTIGCSGRWRKVAVGDKVNCRGGSQSDVSSNAEATLICVRVAQSLCTARSNDVQRPTH